MAFEKTVTLDNGYDVTYWRIISVTLNWARKRGSITLAGYKDRDARFDNPVTAIMTTENVSIDKPNFEEYFAADTLPNDSIEDPLDKTGLDRELAYNYVKLMSNTFSDAQNILE